jgi:hypothetical protein
MALLRRFANIVRSVESNYFDDLGKIELVVEDENIDVIKFKITPNEGLHQNLEYIMTIKFREINQWPLVYIDSGIYDRIKTKQYLANRGFDGCHKGICIKNLSHAYNFQKNFKELCGEKWENYIYNLIIFFNNLQDIGKGVGFKSDYKKILGIYG